MHTLLTALAISTAWAGPRFVSERADLAALADQAWAAGIECTGWEPTTYPEVPITLGYVGGGLAGGANVDRLGLRGITIDPKPSRRTLVHEVAHAWAYQGPIALTEGRTDRLADCIVEALDLGIPLDPDPGGSLPNMPDLRSWRGAAHSLANPDAGHREAYIGAARLIRVVEPILEAGALWPRDGKLTWRQLEKKLGRAGPRGVALLGVLRGDVATQRIALADTDHDGQPQIAEVLDGTDPTRWDSDGDGWWDGSKRPTSPAAIPIPGDGTPVCAGFSGLTRPARIQVLKGGDLRGAPLPGLRVQVGDTLILDDPTRGVHVPTGEPVLLTLDDPRRSAGGAWAIVGGTGLSDAWNCRSDTRWTVYTASPHAALVLDDFTSQLDLHLRRADALLNGPSKRRLVVALSADATGILGETIALSTGQVDWARANGRPDVLAGLAVALHRIWVGEADLQRWDTTEAFARALIDDPPETLFVSVDTAHMRTWEHESTVCAEGWDGVLDGDCSPAKTETKPDAPAERRRRPLFAPRRNRNQLRATGSSSRVRTE